jgi:hypothetical protein
MDKEVTIIMLGIIAVIILPFLLFYFFKKRREIKFLKHFRNLAQQEKLIISQKEFWDHSYAIAIDTNLNKIIYAKRLRDETAGTIIDLADVEKCRIVSTDKTQKSLNGKDPQTDRLDLVFTFRNSDMPEKVLEFYENTEFMPNTEDRFNIEKWYNIINSNLKETNK